MQRRPRVDAARNRRLLIDAAKARFAQSGAGTTLEEIARAAGVGIGTLYRHFPTRERLIEAVYGDAVAQLGEAAERLAASRPPLDALREWLLVFIDYLGTKKLMAEVLTTLGDGVAPLYAASGATLRGSIETLVRNAEAEGAIRRTVEPYDLLRAIGGIVYGDPEADTQAGARMLVDVLIAGMRTPAT